MEKLIYLLWKDDRQSRAEFSRQILEEIAPELTEEDALGVQVNVVDEAIKPAEHMLIENSKPRYHAMISLWLETAISRPSIEVLLGSRATRVAGYLVTESCPLPNTERLAPLGERTPGFSQVVLLQKPPRLSYPDWIEIWHNSHTQIALDTQSTFLYRQNVIARPLTYAAPHYDAIVEEAFPEAAMTSWQAFYDAQGNEARFQKHQQGMLDSCSRFIDFDKIDACSTSEYVFKTFRDKVGKQTSRGR